jgi:hypothetical protein
MKASGSSADGFAIWPWPDPLMLTRQVRVTEGRATEGAFWCPQRDPPTGRPLPSPGFCAAQVPGFAGTTRRCDSLRSSPRASLPSLRGTTGLLCVRSSFLALRAGPRQAGSWSASAPAGTHPWKTEGLPSSWRVLMCIGPVLRPRQDRHARPFDAVGAAPYCPRRRLPRQRCFRGSIARLWHSLSTLRRALCGTRRKTRFPLLAAVRGGIGHPQDSYRRFPTVVILLPQTYLAQGQSSFPLL